MIPKVRKPVTAQATFTFLGVLVSAVGKEVTDTTNPWKGEEDQ